MIDIKFGGLYVYLYEYVSSTRNSFHAIASPYMICLINVFIKCISTEYLCTSVGT